MNPSPLEKQLLDITLAKGLNERARPETASPSDTLTIVDNLYQSQENSLVKRYGTSRNLVCDDTATYPTYVRKILSFLDGWGCVANGGKLLHKQNTLDTFRTRQQLLDFNVSETSFIGSAGPRAATTSGLLIAGASCSTHDAVVVAGPEGHQLTICERVTGVTYTYDLLAIVYPMAATVSGGTHAVFVADRYLHLYLTTTDNAGVPGKDVCVAVIDCGVTLPATEASVTNVTQIVHAGGGGLSIRDAVGGSTRSYALLSNSTVYTYDTAGVAIDSQLLADAYTSMDVDEVNGNLWFIKSGATAKFTARSSTDSTTQTVAPFTATKPGTYISCDLTTGGLKVVYDTTVTFGGTTIQSTEVLTLPTAASVDLTVVGSFIGWRLASKPFYSLAANKHFIQLSKLDSVNSLSALVIADLSSFTGYHTNTSGLALPYGSVRLACAPEPYYGMQVWSSLMRVQAQDGGRSFGICVPYQTGQRTLGYAVAHISLDDPGAYGSANFSGSCYIAHGGLNCYDGRKVYEQGFVDMPVIDRQAAAGALTGAYKYVAVYRYVDANGTSSYSRVYGPVSATNAGNSNLITVQQHAVTNRDGGNDSRPFIEVYRTLAGGTQYYLVASSAVASSVQVISINATTGLGTFTDSTSDATLATQAVMYRQPGTPNAAVDRYCAPSTNIVIQHKDRLFCADSYGNRVYYSSFFVDGEAAWFNPAFNFFVHDGSGPVTGMASMDGRLVVFKRDRIFMVDGDGPAEGGPTGNEFSPPQALATRYGCVDHRSIVMTSEGVMYRSARGIEILTRSLQVKWIGDRVQETIADYPVTTGVCLDQDGLVRFSLAASEGSNGVGSADGVEVVYDTNADAWSRFVYKDFTGTATRSRQAIGLVTDEGVEKVAFGNYGGVELTDRSTFLDLGAYYTSFVLETGWIRTGQQARARFSRLLALLKKMSNHALTMSVAFGYNDTYTQTHTWEPVVINALTIQELEMQLSKQEVMAVRLKISDNSPTPMAIATSTDATPIVVTHAAAHGLSNGDVVTVANHLTNVAANGTWTVANATTLTYELAGSVGSGAGGGTDGTASLSPGTGQGCDVLGITVEIAAKTGAPKGPATQRA